MGWDYGRETVKEMKNRMRDEYEREGYQLLAEKTEGSEWWIVLETPAGDRVITLVLVDRRGASVGVKVIPEYMGPYYYKCPTRFFDLAPNGNSEWRAAVRRHQGDA